MGKSFEEKVAEAKLEVPSISPQEASKRKNTDPTILFIDPRDTADIQATTGMIPDALNVTLNDLCEKAESELPQELSDRFRSIITSCQGGPMGAIAAYALKLRGYQNIHFMDGGTQAWLDAGFATH